MIYCLFCFFVIKYKLYHKKLVFLIRVYSGLPAIMVGIYLLQVSLGPFLVIRYHWVACMDS